MGTIKAIMKNLIDCSMGRYEFFRHAGMKDSWGGPFNGQKFRQRIFFDLLYYLPIKAIVETGTFRGTTTALFAATSLPVYSADINRRYFCYSKMRFLFNPSNICLYRGDSRSFLRDLYEDRSVPREDVFFYLDAHAPEDRLLEDLPLLDELEIIFSEWKQSIVMIDDFEVPDSAYRFNDYGHEKALNLAYIDSVVSAHSLSVFFPAADSSEETGKARGCVVLCPEKYGVEMDAKMKTLVRNTSGRESNKSPRP